MVEVLDGLGGLVSAVRVPHATSLRIPVNSDAGTFFTGTQASCMEIARKVV